jgi:hypothetical protein
MGIARLLARGWVIFCLFAAAHALRLVLLRGQPLDEALPAIGICALLFMAMGLLFVGGFGVSAGGTPWLKVYSLEACNMDGGRVFAAAFAWLLAIIYLASAASRLKLQAGLIRLEAGDRPQIPGPTLRAFLFGIVAVVGIQFLFVGSAYPWLHCSAFADVTGALLIGLAPLMLAYLIVAALASLMASAPENK